MSEYIATFPTRNMSVWCGRNTHLALFTIAGMQLDSKVYSHHPADMLWLLFYRCVYCYRLFMCVCFLWVFLCFVWEWSFCFYLLMCRPQKSSCVALEMNPWIAWGQSGMLWPEYVELLLLKTGKNKMQMLFGLNQTMQYHALKSWIPCDTEDARLLCPSKSSPSSKVRRTSTQWLPKNLASKSTLPHCFPLPPLLTRQFIRCFDSEWHAVKVYPSCQSRTVVDWSFSCKPTRVAYLLE